MSDEQSVAVAALVPNSAAAVEFLKRRGIEPVLSAKWVVGDGGRFDTKAWRNPVDWNNVKAWLDTRQGKANLYYAVNPSSGAVDKKTKRADVVALQWLHVDCDVRPGEDQAEGIRRIITKLEAYDPPPSYTVISGGGAQAFWKLDAPVPVGGDLSIAEDLKLYNLRIEQQVEGDHCHSLDHIMRLPGTINVPDAKKIAKGRKPALASLYKWGEVTYALDRFPKAEVARPEAPANAFSDTGTYENVRSDDQRLNALDAKWIQVGVHGDTEGKFLGRDGKTDRSRMALAFVTACLRAGIEAQLIASLIMDPSWLVGECIRDKAGETPRQLKRLIERAQKFVDQDFLKPAILGVDTWVKNAEVFIARMFPDGLVYWRGDWHTYRNGVWERVEEGHMKSFARKFMAGAKMMVTQKISDTQTERVEAPFNPNNNDGTELLSATRDLAFLPEKEVEQPCWIEYDGTSSWVLSSGAGRPSALSCVNCKNGVLDVTTRELHQHSPEFFCGIITDYDYDPAATCPLWLKTVADYWPGADALEPKLLQEMIAYSLTPRTDLQKLFAVIGPGGSGKGTIMKVLEFLVGSESVASVQMGAFAKEFGKAALLYKTICVVGEAKFGRQDDRAAISNTLKDISGEDKFTVGRKYKDDWCGRLLVRIWLFGNEVPDFEDAGKAMMRRLVCLCMTRTFGGTEDFQLAGKLKAESAGILNWTLEGYERLTKAAGKFTMPPASLALTEVFGRLASPLMAFLEEYCDVTGDVDKDYEVEHDLHAAYEEWCEKVGMRPRSMAKLIESIVSLDPMHIKRVRPRIDGKDDTVVRPRALGGLKLLRPAPVRKPGGRDKSGENQDRIPF